MKQAKEHVLIIEDEQTIHKMLVEKFILEGFDVLSAIDGVEGLSLALSKHPDIILLDMIMPRMDGIEVLKELRKDPWGKNVPVLVLSNVDDQSYLIKTSKFNVAGYLVKINTTPSEIFARVQSLIK